MFWWKELLDGLYIDDSKIVGLILLVVNLHLLEELAELGYI